MQSAKSHSCPLHPSETLSRVNKDPSASKTLYCMECVLSGEFTYNKEDVITIPKLLEEYAKSQTDASKISDSVPSSLQKAVDQKEELYARISHRTEELKLKAQNAFAELETAVLKEIQKQKDRLQFELDSQLSTVQTQFNVYEKQLKKYFGPNTETEGKVTEQELLRQLEQTQDSIQYEAKMKELVSELASSKEKQDEESILQTLKEQSEILQEIDPSKLDIPGLASLSQEIQSLQQSLEDQIADLTSIDNSLANSEALQPSSYSKYVIDLLSQSSKKEKDYFNLKNYKLEYKITKAFNKDTYHSFFNQFAIEKYSDKNCPDEWMILVEMMNKELFAFFQPTWKSQITSVIINVSSKGEINRQKEFESGKSSGRWIMENHPEGQFYEFNRMSVLPEYASLYPQIKGLVGQKLPDFKFDSPVKGYLVIDGEGSSDILQGKIHSIKRILAYKRKN